MYDGLQSKEEVKDCVRFDYQLHIGKIRRLKAFELQ